MAQSAKAIGPAFQMAGQMMKQAISDLWAWFSDKFFGPVMDGISEMGDFFGSTFNALMNPIDTIGGAFSGMFDTNIDKMAVLEEGVNKAFEKDWDGMLSLKSTPEWMDEATWQELQMQSSVMAAQDWDGMLNLKQDKPDWMTTELWTKIKDDGKEAANQQWFSYFDMENKPDWMTDETYEKIKDQAHLIGLTDWDAAFEFDEKPNWMTDAEWERIKTTATGGAAEVKAEWDKFLVDSDEPEWSQETFWATCSENIKTQIDGAFIYIMEKVEELKDRMKDAMNPASYLSDGWDSFKSNFTSIDADFSGSGVGTSFVGDGVIGPSAGTIIKRPEGSIRLHPNDSIIAGTNLFGGGGGGGSSGTVNVVVNASGITDRTDKRQLAREIGNMIQQEMSRSIGGTTMRGRYS